MSDSKFVPEPVDPEQVREYRDRTGVGMIEARDYFMNGNLQRALSKLRSEGTLEDKVAFLLDRYAESLKVRR